MNSAPTALHIKRVAITQPINFVTVFSFGFSSSSFDTEPIWERGSKTLTPSHFMNEL